MSDHTLEQRIPVVVDDEIERLKAENARLRGALLGAADHAKTTAKWFDEQSMPIAASIERSAAERWTATAKDGEQ